MIGRLQEQRTIAAALSRAADAVAGVVMVTGGAGIGKTELLRYAAESASRHDPRFRVIALGATEFDSAGPVTVLTTLIHTLRSHLASVAQKHRAVLSAVLGGPGRVATDVVALSIALLNLIAEASEDARPLMISIDDIQWLDDFSIQVLAIVLRLLQAEAVLVLLAGRVIPAPLVRPGTVLDLPALTRDDCAQLLAEVAKTRPPQSVTADLQNATQGNPLMLSEVARLLSNDQLEGHEPLPDPLPIGRVGLALVGPSLMALSARTRRALTVVALAGTASRLAIPIALPHLGLSVEDLDEAVDSGILRSTSWSFRHPLYASASLDLAPPPEIRRVHGCLAETFRDQDIRRHAHHLAAAAGGIDAAAADAMEEAAVVGSRRTGLASAAPLWKSSVDLSPPGVDRTRRLLIAAESHSAVGQRDTARRYLAELGGSRLSAAELGQAARTRSALLPWSPDFGRDLHALDEASVALADGDPELAADIAMNLALVGFSIGSEQLVWTNVERALKWTANSQLPHQVASWLHAFSWSLFRGVRWDAEFSGLLDPSSRRFLVTRMPLMCAGLGQGLIWVDRRDISALLRGELIAYLRETGAQAHLPYPLTTGAELAWWSGGWDRGQRDLAEAIELGTMLDQAGLLGYSWALRAVFAAATGDTGELDVSIAQAETGRRANVFSPVDLYVARARIHDALVRGEYIEAVRIGESAQVMASRIGLVGVVQVPFLAEYAEAAVLIKHPDADALCAEFQSRVRQAPAVWGEMVGLRLQAMSTTVASEAQALFERAVSVVTAEHMPFEHARTRHRYGEQLLAYAAVDAAREQLRIALDLYEQLGARAWRDRCAAALRRAGGRGRRVAAPRNLLTTQQERVCDLIAHGATNREAADRLFLSTKTIEYHVSGAMKTLGASNRTDLSRRFLALHR